MKWMSLGGVLGTLALSWAMTVWPVSAQEAGEVRIAVLEVERILRESVSGQEVLANLEKLREEKRVALEQQAKELEDLQSRYEQTRLTLADDKLAEMEKELEDRAIALRRSQDDAQRELQKRQQEDFGRIEREIMPVINKVGQELGFTLIFNKFQSGLVYADESVDITGLVIERLNATNGAGD